MASFQISQETIIQNAKNYVLDGDWRNGLNYLVDSFENLTLDIACSILSGQKTISNDKLIDDNDFDYKQELKEIYSSELFLHDNSVYECSKIIHTYDLLSDIKARDLSYEIPEAVTYVNKYMLKEDEKPFIISSSKHTYIGVIGKKKDKNTLPLWFKNEDFYSSYKKLYNTKYPAQKTSEKINTINNCSLDSLDIKIKESIALNTAKSHGFNTPKDFSNHLRQPILKAIKEKNITWKEIELTLNEKKHTIKYPYDIAMAYALSRTSLKNIAPQWIPISPSGIKMDNDSALHTDLWLAIGYDLDGSEYIKSNINYILFQNLITELQKIQFKGSDFTTLNSCSLKSFSGNIVPLDNPNITKNDILVIPHAGPEFQTQAFKAGLVICEVGGKLSHLAIVGREEGIPLIRVDNATKIFSVGIHLNINFETAEIYISK